MDFRFFNRIRLGQHFNAILTLNANLVNFLITLLILTLICRIFRGFSYTVFRAHFFMAVTGHLNLISLFLRDNIKGADRELRYCIYCALRSLWNAKMAKLLVFRRSI